MSETVTLFGEEYDDSFLGFVDFLTDSIDPRNIVREPSLNSLMRMGYVPAHFYGAAKLIAFGVGEKIGFTEMLMHSTDMRKKMMQKMLITGVRTSIVTAPVVASVAGSIAYEKAVNEPLRRASPGSSGTWFGPFASGFGSVV